MKHLKIVFAALMLTTIMAGVFAFTGHDSSTAKKFNTTFYRKAGADKHTPASYQTTAIATDGFTGFVNSVSVIPSEIYTSGPNNGLPKVDVSTTAVFSDVNTLNPSTVIQRGTN